MASYRDTIWGEVLLMSIADRIRDKKHPCVRAFRMAKSATLKSLRDRMRRAKLFQYAMHPRAIMSFSDRLTVAFAQPEFMQAEIEWLRGIK